MYGRSREAEQLNKEIPQSDILGDTRVNGWGIFLCFRMRGSPDFVILLLQNCLQFFVVSILTTGGALGAFIPQMAIAMFSKKGGIGGADIKLSTAAALSLGFYGGVIGYMIGLVFAIVFQTIYNKVKKQSNKEAFPLLPFLSTGLMIGYFI